MSFVGCVWACGLDLLVLCCWLVGFVGLVFCWFAGFVGFIGFGWLVGFVGVCLV